MRNEKSKKILLLLGMVIVIVIAICMLVAMMHQSIETSMYAERKELLGRLTESSASVINDNIRYGQSLMDIFADDVRHDIKDYPQLEQYAENIHSRASYADILFFFVDRNGKYYSSDGVYGKIVDTTYYTSTSADKLSYIASLPHMKTEKTYLIFRNRLMEPLHVNTEQGETELIYCGILYDIDNLNRTISQEFAGTNNTFIYDNTNGVMLYKNFSIKMLLNGYNIYPKFSQSQIVFGEDPASLEQICRNRQTVVVSLAIGGTEYYFCSAPISPKLWSVAFIVQAQYLDEISGNAFADVVFYIAIIAVILGTAILFLIISFYKNIVSAKSLEKITEINKELERATNAKSDFLSNMSHDIRTPMNGIIGMTTIAKGVTGNPERTKECLDKIEGASHHLLSLINDVLDMSRIERGKTEITSKPIDIRMVSDNCCSIIKGQMTGRNLELITEITCVHHRLIGDDLHLRQIFINILGNAVKFTKDGGTIWFRCKEIASSEETATLAFEIEDTGIGMRPDYVSKVFDAFTQDEGGARSQYKGTGLGMAITKQLTELMGGTIEVESELSKGSKFTVTIPFVMNTEEPEEEKIIAVGNDLKGIKLLLAEDNELNMEIAVDLLEAAGAIVTPVEDGRKALEAFDNNPPGTFDVILMDIMMPVMNGIEATKAIRSLPREDAHTIPILAMTANAFESDIQATSEAGMNAHLFKPINIDEVIKTVAYHTRK